MGGPICERSFFGISWPFPFQAKMPTSMSTYNKQLVYTLEVLTASRSTVTTNGAGNSEGPGV